MRSTAIQVALAIALIFSVGMVSASQTTELVTHEQISLSFDDMFAHNMVVTFQDPGSFVHAELIDIEPDTALALPDQEGGEDALLVIYDVAGGVTGTGWGGLIIGFGALDVSQYDGITFNFHGMGTGNYVDINIQEGEDLSTAQSEAESYTYMLGDNADGWITVQVPFADLAPDAWQSEHAVVDGFDGTAIHGIVIDVFGAGFFVIEGIQLYQNPGGDQWSRTDMIVNTWVFEEVVTSTIVAGVETVDAMPLEGSDYEIEFFEDGTFVVRNDGATLPGTWVFCGDDGLRMAFDSAPEIVYSSIITRLTFDELWVVNTNAFVCDGTQGVTIGTAKHVPK